MASASDSQRSSSTPAWARRRRRQAASTSTTRSLRGPGGRCTRPGRRTCRGGSRSRLLAHLAQRALDRALVDFELALGERPVEMLRAVHDSDSHPPESPARRTIPLRHARRCGRRAGPLQNRSCPTVTDGTVKDSCLLRLACTPCPPGESRTDIEVEWQLDALDLRPVERWLALRTGPTAIAEPIEGLGIVPAAPRRLVDVYVDTDDWRMGRAGYVLRVRRRAGRVETTLKDLSTATKGLRRRSR